MENTWTEKSTRELWLLENFIMLVKMKIIVAQILMTLTAIIMKTVLHGKKDWQENKKRKIRKECSKTKLIEFCTQIVICNLQSCQILELQAYHLVKEEILLQEDKEILLWKKAELHQWLQVKLISTRNIKLRSIWKNKESKLEG